MSSPGVNVASCSPQDSPQHYDTPAVQTLAAPTTPTSRVRHPSFPLKYTAGGSTTTASSRPSGGGDSLRKADSEILKRSFPVQHFPQSQLSSPIKLSPKGGGDFSEKLSRLQKSQLIPSTNPQPLEMYNENSTRRPQQSPAQSQSMATDSPHHRETKQRDTNMLKAVSLSVDRRKDAMRTTEEQSREEDKREHPDRTAVRRTKTKKRRSQPPEETTTYQSLDVTQLPSNQVQREPMRRAVVVGCNYIVTPDVLLRGACNDAAAMALTLVNMCDFHPSEILLLMDCFPASCYRTTQVVRDGEKPGHFINWKERQPSRRNILLALNWLRADTAPGDVLVFYFSGHGIQVDDMSGWEGEGYDEAILPMDFFGDEVNAITAVQIRHMVLNVANDVQLTLILDCNGGQTMLDPCGTGGWNYVKGIKQKGVWPFVTDATDKVSRAIYDSAPWMDEAMKRRGARPRFVPGVDVSSTQDLLDPTLQKPISQVGTKVKGYLFCGAPWSQSAIEAKMPAITVNPVNRKCQPILTGESPPDKQHAYHGVFTWCFLTALKELVIKSSVKSKAKIVPFGHLLEDIEIRLKFCRNPTQGGLPKLDQYPELTFYRSGGGDGRDFFLWPFGGRRRATGYSTRPIDPVKYPCFPHEQNFLSAWEAEEQLCSAGEIRRMNDPAFVQVRKHAAMASLLSQVPFRAIAENSYSKQAVRRSGRHCYRHGTTTAVNPAGAAFGRQLPGPVTVMPRELLAPEQSQFLAADSFTQGPPVCRGKVHSSSAIMGPESIMKNLSLSQLSPTSLLQGSPEYQKFIELLASDNSASFVRRYLTQPAPALGLSTRSFKDAMATQQHQYHHQQEQCQSACNKALAAAVATIS